MLDQTATPIDVSNQWCSPGRRGTSASGDRLAVQPPKPPSRE
jgi:hypothetical protein